MPAPRNPDFYNYRSNPEVIKYQGFDVMTRQVAGDFAAWQQDKLPGKPDDRVQYAIVLHSTKRVVGNCTINL
ncbi:hypothetical protein RvY_13422 [Ramazzottius varieornatus]|uniref:Uncharacterized protein n=1 Tax=Ramazzottius varieornatus TaxID=947166 RepID=A0A1D1VMS8_RAMVA|nr:hypothetical protein RvY_13422 [Ramazzottius varieornatus]